MDKFAGDVVFGVFGAPTTHEDDAERALRAGLSILQHVREQDPADPARELGVRIMVVGHSPARSRRCCRGGSRCAAATM